MKILVISSSFPNKVQYQNEMYVYELIRELTNRCNFHVLCPISRIPPFATSC